MQFERKSPVAYGNDKRLFFPQKKQHGRRPSGAVCRILYQFYVIRLSVP